MAGASGGAPCGVWGKAPRTSKEGDKMQTVAERLKYALNLRNMRPIDLSEKTGIGKSSISQYLSNMVKPKQDRIFAMAKALNVDELWLMGFNSPIEGKTEELSEDIKNLPNFVPMLGKPVPIIGTIAAGKPILAEENIEGYSTPYGAVKADFALRVKGDSMTGVPILDGDIVFIRCQPEVNNGEIAAVLIDGEATLKRFYNRGESIMLVAENPKYSPFVYTKDNCDEFRILGKAVACQHFYE